MSRTNEQLRAIEDFQADFDEMLSQRNYNDAEVLIDNMGDLGYETEAAILHRALNYHMKHEDEIDAENESKKTSAERRGEYQDARDASGTYPY